MLFCQPRLKNGREDGTAARRDWMGFRANPHRRRADPGGSRFASGRAIPKLGGRREHSQLRRMDDRSLAAGTAALNVLEIDDPPAVETAPPPLLERSHPGAGRGIGTLNRGRGDILMTSSDQAAGLSFHPCSFNRSQYACAQFIASHSSWKSSVRTMSRSCRICTSTGMPCGYMMQRTSVARRRRHHSMRAPGWTVYVDTCVGAPFLAPTANREFGRFKRNAACASRAACFLPRRIASM